MKNHQESLILIVKWLFIVGVSGLIASPVYAKEVNYPSGMAFNFQTVPTDNQRTEGNYFDLSVKAGAVQELQVSLNNLSAEDLTIKPNLLRAVTTSEGKISYGTHQDSLVDSPIIDINQVISLPDSVVVPKKSSQLLTIKVAVPKSFDRGTILAGVELINETSDSKLNDQVENKYAYLFSIALHQEKAIENTVAIKDSSLLSDNGKLVLTTPIVNDQVGILRELKITTKLINQSTKKEEINQEQTALKMAPESTLDYQLPINKLAPGTYQVETTVEFPDKKKISATSSITLAPELNQGQLVSSETFSTKDASKTLYHLLIITIIVLLISLGFYQLFQRKKAKGH